MRTTIHINQAEQPVIEVEHLFTRFGKAVVHEDINLTIVQGEIFAIAGGNGTGKSTLLREIIGLHKPVEGTIRLFGRDISTIGEQEIQATYRRVGVMFQHGALFSSLTLAENVAVPLKEHSNLSWDLIRDIVALKIATVGLPADSAGKFPNELSGGMRRRAALARAIVMDPELLFLDEPTAGLDPVIAAGFDELVLHLKSVLGLTVIMVTHDLDSLWRIADRVAVLGNGRILCTGTMEELARSNDPGIHDYFQGPRGRTAQAQHG